MKLNVLEFYSLLSTILTLFSGALFVCEIGNNLKAICFLTIVLVNCIFCLNWFCSILNLAFFNNLETLQKKFPKFTSKFLSLLENMGEIIQRFNVVRYLKRMMMVKNRNNIKKKMKNFTQDFNFIKINK